jgi:hypothetical protein
MLKALLVDEWPTWASKTGGWPDLNVPYEYEHRLRVSEPYTQLSYSFTMLSSSHSPNTFKLPIQVTCLNFDILLLLILQELSLILEGSATVTIPGGKAVQINTGDFAVFPKKLVCTWVITESLKKKYYEFSR